MKPSGPIPARIAIIGDWPSTEDIAKNSPFSGFPGKILDSLLLKTGILRTACFITNILPTPFSGEYSDLVSDRKTPPSPEWKWFQGKWTHSSVVEGVSRVQAQLEEVSPTVIIVLGELPLWALTGNSGIRKWRGSRLGTHPIIVPSLHPSTIVREPELRPVALLDFKRALALLEGTQRPRDYAFTIAPTAAQCRTYLYDLLNRADAAPAPILLSGDLETRLGHIACFGIADSPTTAFCIPFLDLNAVNPFYFPLEEEACIVSLLTHLLTHKNIIWVGQNFLYDCQYFHRFWGVYPDPSFDTMIGHHSIFSNMRKGLDFLSAMYAHDHVYWKDEIKDWNPEIGEKQFWTYNCKDACITWEIWQRIVEEQASQGISPHFYFRQALFGPVLRMMNRGIRIDTGARLGLRKDLLAAAREREDSLTYMVGHDINPRSPAQLQKFFYKDLKLPGVRSLSATDKFTINSPALAQIADRNPVLRPLCQTIAELRSIGVFLSTFINAELDSDNRMRCSFSIAGPTTFRFSSSENAFGSGMNLQNIPVAEKEKIKSPTYIKLPNIRKLFIPDENYTFFDLDLDRADLQVVVWEADDSDLKLALRTGIDLHLLNACVIFDIKGIPYDELTENHSNYREHRLRIGESNRAKAKMGVHATNYGVGDYKLAQSLGITVREAGTFRGRWFAAHPGIRSWHLRTEEKARTAGYVENRFGARLNILGRFDLPECLAWLPQSTVADVINRGLLNIDAAEQRGETSIQLLLQVHDSLGGQFLTSRQATELTLLRQLTSIPIPYDDPLVIPVGINTSTQSWGHCK